MDFSKLVLKQRQLKAQFILCFRHDKFWSKQVLGNTPDWGVGTNTTVYTNNQVFDVFAGDWQGWVCVHDTVVLEVNVLNKSNVWHSLPWRVSARLHPLHLKSSQALMTQKPGPEDRQTDADTHTSAYRCVPTQCVIRRSCSSYWMDYLWAIMTVWHMMRERPQCCPDDPTAASLAFPPPGRPSMNQTSDPQPAHSHTIVSLRPWESWQRYISAHNESLMIE